jgi:hypothetical protein
MSRTARLFGGAIAVAAAAVALLCTSVAVAFVALSPEVRNEIVHARAIAAPDGGFVTNPDCIAGRLSTVDRRWAVAYLTNSPSCVRQFGGASGEGVLLRRPTMPSVDWTRSAPLATTVSAMKATRASQCYLTSVAEQSSASWVHVAAVRSSRTPLVEAGSTSASLVAHARLRAACFVTRKAGS